MDSPSQRRFSLLLAVVLAGQAIFSGLAHRHCDYGCASGENHRGHAHAAKAAGCSHHATCHAKRHSPASQPADPQPLVPGSPDDDDCLACRYLAQRVIVEMPAIELAKGEFSEPADFLPPVFVGGSAPSLPRCRAPPAC